MGSIAAVVVTFNRLEKLKKVIEAVLGQQRAVDMVVVVDNASTDGTSDYLAGLAAQEERVQVLTLASNTGGAGGFSAGMEKGYQLGADFVWVMDDDGYPEPDALAALERGFAEGVRELGPNLPFACSVVKFIDGSICEMNNPVPTWDWGRLVAKGQRAVTVKSCSFVSVLIPRWVIQMFGLPLAEYFIWYDDAEYTQRVSELCPGIQVLDSTVLHDMGVNQGVNYGMVDDKSLWKFKYGARNEASFRLHRFGLGQYALFAVSLLQQMASGAVPMKHRAAIMKEFVVGGWFNPEARFPATDLPDVPRSGRVDETGRRAPRG